MSLSALIHAAAIRAELRGDADVGGLEHDHRRVSAGVLFCCIPGQVVDGHDFAAAAVEAGASALLVERFLDLDVAQARVEETRPVLGPLSAAFYEKPSATVPIAAVTGTNGKTTVTYLLEAIAKAAGREPGVIGTVSRRFKGVEEPALRNTPEAIELQRLFRRMVDARVDFIAMEATSDGLAQGRLAGTHFATAGFTNLTQDHLNTHGSMEAYFEAKALLFDGSYSNNAVINVRDPYGEELVRRTSDLNVLTYGTDDSDIVADVELGSFGFRGTARTPSGDIEVSSPLVGRHNIENAMCALGIALQCGFSPDAIVSGLAAMDDVPGRLEKVDAGQAFLAVVDYAHTPDALDHAVRTCKELATGRLTVVFGCGGDRDRAKRPLMGEAATRTADLTIVTSDNPRSEDPEAIIREIEPGAKSGGGRYELVTDRRDAIRQAIGQASDGDVVLVAGKGHEQGQQFADRTIPFDDATVIREAIEEASCRS